MSFEITIVEFPVKHLVGMKVSTSMQKAQTDCPQLWQTFGPRIIEIPSMGGAGAGAYGISVMLNENDFNYWAAVEINPEADLPDGMETITISAGLYAKCTVPGLEKLGEAFMFLYGPWIQIQKEYTLDMQAPCFELYPQNWRLDTVFDVYAPVKKS